MTQPATSPGQELIAKANQDIEQYKKTGAHILAPITLQTIPFGHRPVVVAVYINPDPKMKEVYPQKGGGLSLTSIAWKKLADGMGIQMDAGLSGRVDDGRDSNRCHYRMVGWIKAQDGTWRQLIGDKEIRMENVIEELYETKKEKAEKYLADPKDGPAFRKDHPDTNQWIQDQVRSEALQIKKHLLARSQSGAMNRMIKSMGIRETYTAEELKRPFVFPKLVFELDPLHEGDRHFLRMQAAGAISQMYRQNQPTAQIPLQDPATPPIGETRAIEYHVPPAEITHEPAHEPASQPAQASTPAQPEQPATPPPTEDEALKGLFPDATPAEQKNILTTLVKRKNYRGKITGDMAEWKPAQRVGFFTKLMSLPDAVQTPADVQPFE